MKRRILILVLSAIVSAILLIIITTLPQGTRWTGIAISDEGLVYLGTNKSIFICNEAHDLEPVINATRFRDYRFTIEHDKLIIVKSKNSYIFSLNGLLLQKEANDGKLFRELSNSSYAQINNNGMRYQMKNILGYQYITKIDSVNNKVSIVYQMPIGYYLLCILLIISFVIFGLSVLAVVINAKFNIT